MLKFNQDKVRKLTSEILATVERLEDLKKLSKEDFLSDPHKIGSAKYSFIVAIEGMIDLCNHIIAKMAIEHLRIMLIPSGFWLKRVHLMKNIPIP